MTRLLFALSALLCLPTLTYAYQFEIRGSNTHTDGNLSQQANHALQATWYTKDVGATRGPLAEAAFVERRSNLSYSFSKSDLEVRQQFFSIQGAPLPAQTSAETESKTHTLAYVHYLNGRDWYLGARLIDASSDIDGPGRSQADQHGQAISVGYYLAPRTSLELELSRHKSDLSVSTPDTCAQFLLFPGAAACFSSNSQNEARTTKQQIGLRHVADSFSLRTYASRSEARAATTLSTTVTQLTSMNSSTNTRRLSADNEAYSAGVRGTWYATRSLGFSAGIDVVDQDSNQDQLYTCGVSWFASDGWAVSATASRSHLEGPRDNLSTWGVSVTARF